VFGTGQAKQIDRIEVLWPGGQTTTIEHVSVDQILKIDQPGTAQRREIKEGPESGR
jgi:hypothetical protein